jgi:hypothetical protein
MWTGSLPVIDTGLSMGGTYFRIPGATAFREADLTPLTIFFPAYFAAIQYPVPSIRDILAS